MPSRKDLDKYGREILDRTGWYALVFNFHKRLPKGIRGIPDWLCFRDNVTAVVEVKGDGDTIRDTQKKFKELVTPHLGKNIIYRVVQDLSDWDELVNYRGT